MSGMFNGCSSLTSLDLSHFNTENVTNMSGMFYYCSGLTSLDLRNFNTTKVTNMFGMFYYCSGLTSLDISTFNTENVTNMSVMFYYCSGLTSLDLSSFNTANVTDMSCMFYYCSGLTSLNLSAFNTANVNYMSGMFYYCSGLTSLDLRNFNTAKVTHMPCMFYGCSMLYYIYCKDDWKTEVLEDGSKMFKFCSHLIGEKGTTYDESHIDANYAHPDATDNPGYFSVTERAVPPMIYAAFSDEGKTLTLYYDDQFNSRSSVTKLWTAENGTGYWPADDIKSVTKVVLDESMKDAKPVSTYYWFHGMTNLLNIEHLDYLNTEDVSDMKYMFFECKNLTSLDVSGFNTENVTSMYFMFGDCESLTTLDVDGFDTRKVTNMGGMFYGCENLSALYLFPYYSNKFITSEVTNMCNMFGGCKSLTSVDAVKFETANVTDMSKMFNGCSGIKSLDLTSWDMGKVTTVEKMFYGCSSLTTIKSNEDWAVVSDSAFYNCTSLVGGNGTTYSASHISSAYASPDRPHFPGYFTSSVKMPEFYAVWNETEKILTIYYDDKREEKGGVTDWSNSYKYDYNTKTKKVIFDESVKNALPTSTSNMFLFFSELESIDHLDYLNTEKVTDMSHMFNGCSKLTSLDLSKFNTEEVVSMEHLFSGCSALTALDISEFDYNKVRNVAFMFYGCSGLTELEITYSSSMWCVKDMGYMFAGCTNLKEIKNIQYVRTTYVTDVQNMFYNCSSLTSLNLNRFYTEKVTNFGFMFSGCTALDTLRIPNFEATSADYMAFMFQNCSNLKAIYCYGDWSQYADNISPMPIFEGCSQLVGGNGTVCSGETAFDDINYATPDFGGHPGYFIGGEQRYAVLEDDNTTMTIYYDSLRVIKSGVTDWSIYSNTVTKVIFDESIKEARPGSTDEWFKNFFKLETIEHLDYLNTTQTTNMRYMFCNCRKLKALDLSNFITSNVTNMSYMFFDCESLTSLDLSGFETSETVYMDMMFAYCTSLTSLNVNNFDVQKVWSMYSMFYDCENLTTIYCNHDWSTSKALERSQYMFSDCAKLRGERGTVYNADKTDVEYARPDKWLEGQGYFTLTEEVYAVLEEDKTTLTLHYDKKREDRGGVTNWLIYNNRFGNPNSETNHITKVVFDESMQQARPKSTKEWFDSFHYLEEIVHIEYLNTSEVRNMELMFSNCNKMKTIDVSHFNTSKVTTMRYMFVSCDAMTYIDLNSFDMTNVETTWAMFNGCYNLKTIYCKKDWTKSPSLKVSGLTFGGCTSLAGEKGTAFNEDFTDVSYAHLDGGTEAPGYFSNGPYKVTLIGEHGTISVSPDDIDLNMVNPYTILHLTAVPDEGYIPTGWTNYDPATGLIVTSDTTVTALFTAIADMPVELYADINGTTITLLFDNLRLTRATAYVMDQIPSDVRNTATKIVIDPSVKEAVITSTSNLFANMDALTEVEGLKNINTSELTDVSFLFQNCKSLTEIDLNGFDISGVTAAYGMFMGCTNLTTIICDKDYSSLAGMTSLGMFDGCSNLVGGKGTHYDSVHKDAAYARPDGGPESATPGYFTKKDTGTGVESTQHSDVSIQKVLRDGVIYIERNGQIYDLNGRKVK